MKKFILFLISILPISISSKEKNTDIIINPVTIVKELTVEERVVKVLSDSGFSNRMQAIILAQAKHESGNFKSRLTVKHNNIFGMQHPRKRQTTSICGCARAENRIGYASYYTIEDSVRDYILYYRFINAPDTTVDQYVKFLKKKRYFESSESPYRKALRKWINNKYSS